MIQNKRKKILIIEDDRSLSLIIMKQIEAMGFEANIALDGQQGLEKAAKENYALILTDIALPKMSGFKVVERLRNLESQIPVIIITGFDSQENEVRSFKLGAHIFHKKPINFELLRVQINMLISQYKPSRIVQLGDLELDPEARIIRIEEEKIRLSIRESEFMYKLFSSPGQVLTRREIISFLHLGRVEAAEGSVDTLVSRLREKIGKYKGIDVVETVYGEGYRLNHLLLEVEVD